MVIINANFTNINNDLESAKVDIDALEILLPSAPATTSLKWLTKLSVAPASPTAPIAVWDNDTRVPTQGENDACAGTTGTPSSSNKFVTATDPAYTGIVYTTTDQTVAGIKTFTNIPVLPASDPTTANQAVRKSYADGLVSSSSWTTSDGQVTYNRRGKLYHNITSTSTPSSSAYLPIRNDATTRAKICTLLWITESTNYWWKIWSGWDADGDSRYWDGAAWQTNTNWISEDILTWILAA